MLKRQNFSFMVRKKKIKKVRRNLGNKIARIKLLLQQQKVITCNLAKPKLEYNFAIKRLFFFKD